MNISNAQSPLDCSTSTVSACSGNPSFPFTMNTSTTSYGAVMDLPGNSTSSISNPSTNPAGINSGCLLAGELNATWVTVNISSSGTLQFNIAQLGYTDWAMWPLTPSTCANIQNNTLAPVACNWNASPTGGTGIGPVPPGGNPGNFQPSMTVTAGQSFIICVTNFSNVNGIINMAFTGTAGTSCVPFSSTSSKTICPGAIATLTATSNLAGASYTWMPGSLTTQTVTVSPAATTIYTVTVGGTNTITLTYTTNVSTCTVTVLPNPTITLTSNSMICPSGTINLFTIPGFTNYVWSGPPAYTQTTTITNVSIPGANSGMAGTYSVIGRTAQGCTATATTSVSLIPVSSVTTLPTFSVCQGGSIFLTTTTSVTPTSYNWSGPFGFLSTIQNPTVTTSALPTNSGTYSITTNYTSGTTTCIYSGSTIVNVIPAIPASLPAMSTVCNNGIINLTAPIGGTTYNWAGPNSFTSSVQSPNITSAGIINNGIYTVTITTGLCVNIGTVAVTVYNPLSFTSIPSNLTLCFGKSGVLNSNGAGGSGIYNYSWSPITDLSNPNSATTTVTGSSTTIYSLTLTDANCAVTLGAVTPVTVTVNPSPVITMSTTNSRGCEAFCTDLISLSVPTSTYCEWRFTDNLAYGGCYNPNFCFPTHGVYGATLTVTDVNGCIDSVKNSSFIIVDPNPSADFSWTPDNSTILINEVNFYDHSSIGLPINNWHWDFGDVFVNDANDTSNIQNPSHIYENVYSYSVTLTVVNSFGCRDSVMKLLKVEDDFALFIPNAFTPSKADGKNDIFKVSGIGFLSDSFEMRIYDRWGELVFKTNDINKGWDGSIKGGKIANPDVFIYKITIKDFKNKTREYVGHITIL